MNYSIPQILFALKKITSIDYAEIIVSQIGFIANAKGNLSVTCMRSEGIFKGNNITTKDIIEGMRRYKAQECDIVTLLYNLE